MPLNKVTSALSDFQSSSFNTKWEQASHHPLIQHANFLFRQCPGAVKWQLLHAAESQVIGGSVRFGLDYSYTHLQLKDLTILYQVLNSLNLDKSNVVTQALVADLRAHILSLTITKPEDAQELIDCFLGLEDSNLRPIIFDLNRELAARKSPASLCDQAIQSCLNPTDVAQKTLVSSKAPNLDSQNTVIDRAIGQLKNEKTSSRSLLLNKIELMGIELPEEYKHPDAIQNPHVYAKVAALLFERLKGDPLLFIDEYEVEKDLEEGQYALIEIAKLVTQKTSRSASEDIDKFGIKNQEALIEIAKLAAQQNGASTSIYIQDYGIQNQQALIEIAKLAAQQNGSSTSHFIKNYGIEDQQALIAIAKLAAQQNGEGTSRFIKNYGIEDQQALIEIAKQASQQYAEGTSRHIKNYGIQDPQYRFDIFIEACLNEPKSVELIGFYDLEGEITGILTESLSDAKLKESEFLQKLNDLFAARGTPEEVLEALQSLSFEGDLISQKNKIVLLLKLTDDFNKHRVLFAEFSKETFAWLKLRNPPLQRLIFKNIIQCISQPLSVEMIAKLRRDKSIASHTRLSSIYLSLLAVQNVPHIEEIAKIIKNKRLNGNVIFKDYATEHLLLVALSILSNNQDLSPEKKGEILLALLKLDDKNTLLNALRALNGTFQFNNHLKDLSNHPFTLELLERTFQEAYKTKVPIGEVADFMDKFAQTLGAFRNPNAMQTYAAKLMMLPEAESKKLIKELGTFAREVLEGEFTSQRYENSSHLDQVFKDKPALKEAWKAGKIRDLDPTTLAEKPLELDFNQWIQQSLSQHHVKEEAVPFLFNIFNVPQEASQKGLEELRNELRKEGLTQKQMTSLKFQENIFKLSKLKDVEQAKGILKNCLNHLPKEIQSEQFKHDLEGWLNLLAAKSRTGERAGWKIVDSDDPCDLLLSGTEVEGSCQRVDGDPALNKCLLAYLLDGKNRLLAIKNAQGIIQARAILRILWDGEQPVLFLERLYPNILDSSLSAQLKAFANERALAIGLPIFSSDATVSQRDLHSLSGRASFEYVDASEGVHANGVWSIIAKESAD